MTNRASHHHQLHYQPASPILMLADSPSGGAFPRVCLIEIGLDCWSLFGYGLEKSSQLPSTSDRLLKRIERLGRRSQAGR